MLISELGEEGLIDELRRLFSFDSEDIRVGIGDDAAVIDVPGSALQVWTTDILIEGIHFETSWQEPQTLGRKSMLVNLSDLAAMGARPGYALLSLGLPDDTQSDFVIALCNGIRETADAAGVKVVGGDSSASPVGLVINIALMGTVPGRAVGRSGARPGDAVVVTGELGAAAAGLRLLKEGRASEHPRLVQAFLNPPDRIEAGIAAAGSGATAMTDISDGLATEIAHLCRESTVGAQLQTENLPVPDELRESSRRHGWDETELAITGGEDYELLMTFPREGIQKRLSAVAAAGAGRISVIGEITPAEKGLIMVGADGDARPLTVAGYQHFRNG